MNIDSQNVISMLLFLFIIVIDFNKMYSRLNTYGVVYVSALIFSLTFLVM